MTSSNQARRRVMREEAYAASARWELPDLEGESAGRVELGVIARAEALGAVFRELVADDPQVGPRAAPFGRAPALQWWELTVLPAARAHDDAGWWIRRSPREAISWAVVLDPEGAGPGRI